MMLSNAWNWSMPGMSGVDCLGAAAMQAASGCPWLTVTCRWLGCCPESGKLPQAVGTLMGQPSVGEGEVQQAGCRH